MFSCSIHVKSQFQEKIVLLPIGTIKFPSLVPPRNVIILPQHNIIIQFLLYYLSSGHLREVKTKEKFKILALKVSTVAYKRFQIWWFDLKTFGILEKMVAYERWLQPEVCLFTLYSVVQK